MTRKTLACTIFAAALSFGVAHAASTTINAGGSSLAAPTYIAEFQAYTKANPTILFNFEAVGSGGGQKAFLNNDITQFEPPNVTSSTLTYGTIVGTQVDIGASDSFLASNQLSNPPTGSYANSSADGPIIQIPTFGTPITIPYNESLQTAALTLTDPQICGVLSGKINDWHTLNSKIPAGTTIQVVYRSDSSGTTFLLTQHLNAVCTSANSTFASYPVAITKTFAALFTNSTPPSNFTGESGSQAVANQLVATSGSFGYLSPDYTSIAPKSASTTSLKVATLVNAKNGKSYTPSVANTETGLANGGAGSTNAAPPSSQAAAMNPMNWVPAIPVTTSGYPIVGYTTMDLSTCYASKTAGTAINAFLTDQYSTASYKTIITNNGFAALSNTAASAYVTAVVDIFLSNKDGYNLNIDNATACASFPGR
jgi:ABC-type phosphate transport system substrate-binding protein